MSNRVLALLGLGIFAALLAACSSSGRPATTPTPQMAANLGLARKGLSPSEVDLPCAQAQVEAGLKVVSCRVYRHMGETVHLVGEVENTSDKTMGKVSIKAVGSSSEGEVTDTKTEQAYFDPVPAGKRTPFRVFFDARDAAKVDLTVTGEQTTTEPAVSLAVSNISLTEPSSGYTHIKGEVQNPGSASVDGTFIAVLRDESGQAVEIHREKLLKPLAAGSNTFDVLALHRGAKTADVTIFPN